MKFRFRKSKKILPGVKLHVTHTGISTTLGPKHLNVGVGKRGTNLNTSIPHTGISGTQKLSNTRTNSRGTLVLVVFLIAGLGLVVLLLILWIIAKQ
jgi:hypothetical protein